MKILDPGHIFEMQQLGGGTQTITFVKRSGGAISYEDEWPGVQVQEVLRVLIARTKYLHSILPCTESLDAICYLRMTLFMYEVRAWRRKQESLNRREGAHDDTARSRSWREEPFDDVPFSEFEIELLPTGEDGHIVIP